MISSLALKNFTVFSDLKIDFSPGINVIIGENGTGKTQLLKAAHALCVGTIRDGIQSNGNNFTESSIKRLSAEFTSRPELPDFILRLFMPFEQLRSNLVRHGSNEAVLSAKFSNDLFYKINFDKDSTDFSTHSKNPKFVKREESTFIPTKEVLSIMLGFVSLFAEYELSFDQSYRDIMLVLDKPVLRAENMNKKSIWAIDTITEIIGGKFLFHGGGRVTFKTKTSEMSASSVAEGYRKLGMLVRLLQTGAIIPGIKGPLLWDEPETNLNPKLLKLLAEILLELSRQGQQIILATHDYVLLKWFDLLADSNEKDEVRYHALYKDSKTEGIRLESKDDYRDLKKNALADTFDDLTVYYAKSQLRGASK